MNRTSWKWLPVPVPVLPPRLWFTGAAIGVVGLNLIFNQELWPHNPQALGWSWVLLMFLLVAAEFQVIVALWRWPTAYAGPRWMQLLFRCAAVALSIGIAILMLPLILVGCLLLSPLVKH